MSLENALTQEVAFGYTRQNQDTFYLKESESSQSYNFELIKDGQIGTLTRRPDVDKLVYSGSVDAAPSANPVLGFHHDSNFDGSKYFAYAINGTIYYHNGTSSPDAIATGLNSSAVVRFARFIDNKTYIVNGVDSMLVWDPDTDPTTTSTASGSPPVAKYIVEHKSHLFVAGLSTAPGTLRYCDFEDATTWTITNDFQFSKDITGIIRHENVLIIFTLGEVYMLEGDQSSNFSISELDLGSGCIAPYSPVSAKGSLYYFGNGGISEISSISKPKVISDPIIDEYNALRTDSKPNVHGVFDYTTQEIIFPVNLVGTDNDIATATLCNAFFILELRSGQIKVRLIDDGFVRSAGNYIQSDGSLIAAFGNDVGRINYFNNSSFTGSDFVDHSTTASQTLSYTHAPLDQGDKKTLKHYYILRIWVKPSSGDTFTFKYKTDKLAETTKTLKLDRTPYDSYSQAFLDALDYVPIDVELNCEGSYLIFTVTNTADSTADINLIRGLLFYEKTTIENNIEESS